jgi:hypothetical protein
METHFTLFPCLPPELRTMIWLSSLSPRVLEITSDCLTQPSELDFWYLFHVALPVAFRVCHESRTTVSRLYVKHGPQLLNADLDIFYMDAVPEHHYIPHLFNDLLIPVGAKRVAFKLPREIEPTLDDQALYKVDLLYFKKMLELMPSLKRVFVVLDVEDMPFRSSRYGSCDLRNKRMQMEFFGQRQRVWGGKGQLPALCGGLCGELPEVEDKLQGWDVPEVKAVFGWRHIEGVLTSCGKENER